MKGINHMQGNIRLGDILVDNGYITEEQLMSAIAYQKEDKSKRLGQIFLERNDITEDQLLIALGQRLQLDYIEGLVVQNVAIQDINGELLYMKFLK